jgi:hypothetical protein
MAAPLGRGANANTIRDKFETLSEVQATLRRGGLEKAALILGIDYTASNKWTGDKSYAGRCLHDVSSNSASQLAACAAELGREAERRTTARARSGACRACLSASPLRGSPAVARASGALRAGFACRVPQLSAVQPCTRAGMNPYEQSIAILGRTLQVRQAAPCAHWQHTALTPAPYCTQAFDDDGLVPCYGFGDKSTEDSSVFSLLPGNRPASGFAEALSAYKTLTPGIKLAGPTSFGPIIRHACKITAEARNAFHVLLLIADGQVTRNSDVPDGELSPQEKDTVDALVAASKSSPLAIVMVGVGDGPWDTMHAFDDALPARLYDNFQFVGAGSHALACRRRGVPCVLLHASDAAAPADALCACCDTEYNAILGTADPMAGHYDGDFALACLMELPEQYKAAQRLGLLGTAPARLPALLPSVAPKDPPAPAPAARPAAPAPAQPEKCAICMDAPREAVLVPCGHAVLCFSCASAIMARTPRSCPICRGVPQSHFRVFG